MIGHDGCPGRKMKDFKKCPVCGQKSYECHLEDGVVYCDNEDEVVYRPATQEEIEYWEEQDGFST